MLSVALRRSDVRVTALADIAIEDLRLPPLDGVRQHCTLQAMLEDEAVDAVHIATPTPLHFEQVHRALDAGRHVIVEKPVTCDSESAARLAESAQRGDRAVLVGHSESFEPYVAATRRAIDDDEIGEPVMIVAEKFTDWMRRPRLAEEWDPAMGGGLIRRQGVHQVDVVRTLAEGEYDVRVARTREDPERGASGSYCAWLSSTGATEAFIAHDGIGRLNGGSMPAAAGETTIAGGGDDSERVEKRVRTRRLLARALRERLALGGDDTGRVLVIGTAGEVTVSGAQVEVTGRCGRRAVALHSCPSGRDTVLDEFVAAVRGERAAVHGLAWGAENLRLCERIEMMADANRTLEMKGAR
jgi:phthalate 4,5-cis-dihydrodiol dehydrogenase